MADDRGMLPTVVARSSSGEEAEVCYLRLPCCCCSCSRGRSHVQQKRSYLEDMIANKWRWREEGIVNEPPFRTVTKPLLNIGMWLYLVVGLLQLAFMTTFAVIYTPDWTHCPSGGCDNTTNLWRTDDARYPSWFWLVWPSVLFLYNGYRYIFSVWSHLHHAVSFFYSKLKHRSRPSERKSKFLTRLLLTTVDRVPSLGFTLSLFIWFHAAHRAVEHDSHYYRVTSVVFLFGWITTFMLFCCTSKHVYIFSIVLRDIIVKDIVNSFMWVFVFTIIAFSCALYVLRGRVHDVTGEVNVYEVFASGLTMAEYIEYTIDQYGNRRFFRPVCYAYHL